MNAERETEIRERRAKATPGPWVVWGAERSAVMVEGADEGHALDGYVATCNYIRIADQYREQNQADADFIAHAPEDIAHLLDELDLIRDEERDPYIQGLRFRAEIAEARLEEATDLLEEWSFSSGAHYHNGWGDRVLAFLANQGADTP